MKKTKSHFVLNKLHKDNKNQQQTQADAPQSRETTPTDNRPQGTTGASRAQKNNRLSSRTGGHINKAYEKE